MDQFLDEWRAKINEDPKDALLREFQDTLAKLKAELEGKGGGRRTCFNHNSSML